MRLLLPVLAAAFLACAVPVQAVAVPSCEAGATPVLAYEVCLLAYDTPGGQGWDNFAVVDGGGVTYDVVYAAQEHGDVPGYASSQATNFGLGISTPAAGVYAFAYSYHYTYACCGDYQGTVLGAGASLPFRGVGAYFSQVKGPTYCFNFIGSTLTGQVGAPCGNSPIVPTVPYVPVPL